MNSDSQNSYQQLAGLSPTQLADFSADLEAIRRRVSKKLGDTDAAYIRRVTLAKRLAEVGGRALLFAGAIPQAWGAGVTLLSVSKMLDNMTIGHNVIHGQYDWMNDSVLNSHYKWDMPCPEDLWKRAHNHTHHTYTAILGKDRDLGYGVLRVSEEQPWNIAYLRSFGAIFCGHFPEGTHVQQPCERPESKGARYLRQIRGSANFKAPRWFHILTGHLGYQIEHHLFPTLPANRYEEIASEVEGICRKYGIAYNSRPFLSQFGTVVRRLCELSLPGYGGRGEASGEPRTTHG